VGGEHFGDEPAGGGAAGFDADFAADGFEVGLTVRLETKRSLPTWSLVRPQLICQRT